MRFETSQQPQRPPEAASARTGQRIFRFLVTPLVWIYSTFRFLLRLITSPFRAYMAVRRSMTVASVIALLTSILSLNVIWGFPWNGILGGCIALLVVGYGINRLTAPKLGMSLSLPRSAVAGEPFSVRVRLTNLRFFPAMNMRMGWHREGIRDLYAEEDLERWDASPSISVALLRSGGHMQWQGAMRFNRRGVQTLPPFRVACSFPFFLFKARQELATDTEIAITPAPITEDENPLSRMMLAAIGDWSKQLVVGAPVEYVGNREYQVGMHVRRWDFASWARLGRPIVREYQSPSIQMVTLIIDTSQADSVDGRDTEDDREEAFERLLSFAATAIIDVTSRRIQLQMRLTSDSDLETASPLTTGGGLEGQESLLIRLAGASPVDPTVAENRIINAIDACRSQPVLILSLFDLDSPYRETLAGRLPANVTYLPLVEQPVGRSERVA